MEENEDEKFTRTTAFKALRAREAEEDSRWTGKVATSRGHKSQPIGVRLLS